MAACCPELESVWRSVALHWQSVPRLDKDSKERTTWRGIREWRLHCRSQECWTRLFPCRVLHWLSRCLPKVPWEERCRENIQWKELVLLMVVNYCIQNWKRFFSCSLIYGRRLLFVPVRICLIKHLFLEWFLSLEITLGFLSAHSNYFWFPFFTGVLTGKLM